MLEDLPARAYLHPHGLDRREGLSFQHAARDEPEILAAQLKLPEPADAGAARRHGPAHQGAAILIAGLATETAWQGEGGGLGHFGFGLPVTQQLGAVAHQLQRLFADQGRLGVFEAEHADELLLLQQGAVQAGADIGIGQIIVLAQHGLVCGLREAQGAPGTQGPDVAAVTANGTDRIRIQGEDRGQLLAAEGTIGLVVPEDQAIGPQALPEALQHGGILLLAGHLAQARQLQRQAGRALLGLGLQADEPEGVLFMGEGDMPLLGGKAQQQLAPLAAGQPLLYGLAQGIRQLSRPGAAGLIEPVERGLHHIGQGDQPLTTGIQAKEQGGLAGCREMAERGRRHELTLSC